MLRNAGSESPWTSPLHLAPKKEDAWSPCGDSRAMNAWTFPDHYLVRLESFFHNRFGLSIPLDSISSDQHRKNSHQYAFWALRISVYVLWALKRGVNILAVLRCGSPRPEFMLRICKCRTTRLYLGG